MQNSPNWLQMILDYCILYTSIELKKLVTAIYNYLTFFKILVETGEKMRKNSPISQKSHVRNFASNDLKLNQNVPFHM